MLFSGGKVKGEMKKITMHHWKSYKLWVLGCPLCFFRLLFCTGVNAAFRSQYPAESHQSWGTDLCHTGALHFAICLSILSLVFLPQQCISLQIPAKNDFHLYPSFATRDQRWCGFRSLIVIISVFFFFLLRAKCSSAGDLAVNRHLKTWKNNSNKANNTDSTH